MYRQEMVRQELKHSMEDYLRQKGLSLRRPFRCLSPDHEDNHPSMSYNPRGHNVHCFSCGVTYDIFDLIGLDYGLCSFPERVQKACELFGREHDAEQESTRKPAVAKPSEKKALSGGITYDIFDLLERDYSFSSFPEHAQKACELFAREHDAERGSTRKPAAEDQTAALAELRAQADDDISYFLGRGITVESCRYYGLFQKGGRAYFPVVEGGVCTGWCGRALGDSALPKYRNSSGPIGIWNGDLLRQPGGGSRLFITEGVADAICLEQLGERAVALCGSQNTAKLLQRCAENPQALSGWQFIACGDPDAAGEKMNTALRTGLEKLGASCGVLPLEDADGDVAALAQASPERLRGLLNAVSAGEREYAAASVASSIEAFFEDAARRAQKGAFSTGFAGLDKLLDGGLYPGLYILGAISSLGKTSFVLQVADYIAENSADVLFFSLEQSKFELIAKSLSRTSARLDTGARREAVTARQLLSGSAGEDPRRRRLLLDSREAYTRAAAGLFLREGLRDIGVEEIRAAVREHAQSRGKPPVVVVDYLQILRPSDPRATDKQNTDRAVVELKRISRDFDIPVVAISSFNRENYRAAVSMEAFKESGAVEYSSDVLIGLQLQGAGGKGFDANSEKARDPRSIELVMLKNRNGIPYAKVPLKYYGKFSLFEESGGTKAANFR